MKSGIILRTYQEYCEKMCVKSQLQESLEFVDISTLEERLLGENSITHEFIDKNIRLVSKQIYSCRLR